MNLEKKLNQVLGLEGAGQCTKTAGKVTTHPTFGATTGGHPTKKKTRDESNKRKISRPES